MLQPEWRQHEMSKYLFAVTSVPCAVSTSCKSYSSEQHLNHRTTNKMSSWRAIGRRQKISFWIAFIFRFNFIQFGFHSIFNCQSACTSRPPSNETKMCRNVLKSSIHSASISIVFQVSISQCVRLNSARLARPNVRCVCASNISGMRAKVGSKLNEYVYLQICCRCVTFGIGSFVLRIVDRDVLGIMNVRLLLLESTILFLSREAIRKATLSSTGRPHDKQLWPHIINQLWLT